MSFFSLVILLLDCFPAATIKHSYRPYANKDCLAAVWRQAKHSLVMSGWWFGILEHDACYILGVSSSQVTHIFQRGNHQSLLACVAKSGSHSFHPTNPVGQVAGKFGHLWRSVPCRSPRLHSCGKRSGPGPGHTGRRNLVER